MIRIPTALSLIVWLAACGGSPAATNDSASSDPQASERTTTSGAESPASDPSATSGTPAADTGQGPSADLPQYAARVMAQVRRHWQIPATLSPSEAANLEASIRISIDETTRLPTAYTIVGASGNAIYDESVMRGLQALVDAGEPLPEPPVGLDDRSSVRLRLRARH